ncbi:MAG TPA: hypothetical protein VML75_23440, partial [Kofleriaceae bacterium]|nr:hypothetical protein [Kofleriaceae bacterium]
QGAVWAAVEVGGADPAAAMAIEARVRLPERMFVVVEAARLYRRADGMMGNLQPIWIATAGIGAVVGE